jgi:hypothetical protein
MNMFLRRLTAVFSSRLRVLLLAPLVLLGAPARAEIWGYAGIKGAENFALQESDEDYGVFFRGADGFHEGRGEGGPSRLVKNSRAAGVPGKRSCAEHTPCRKTVNHLIRQASAIQGIDYELLHAVIATESGFRIRVVSPKGAIGLMQLIPPTAERYGIKDDKYSLVSEKLVDPRTNIWVGSLHLHKLITRYPGDIELALAAYNAGEGAVRRAGNRIPNYPETKKYVRNVMHQYKQRLKPPARPDGGIIAGHRRGGVKMKPATRDRVVSAKA